MTNINQDHFRIMPQGKLYPNALISPRITYNGFPTVFISDRISNRLAAIFSGDSKCEHFHNDKSPGFPVMFKSRSRNRFDKSSVMAMT